MTSDTVSAPSQKRGRTSLLHNAPRASQMGELRPAADSYRETSGPCGGRPPCIRIGQGAQPTSRTRKRIGALAQIRNPYHHALNLRELAAHLVDSTMGSPIYAPPAPRERTGTAWEL
jgi:hypothetical protein